MYYLIMQNEKILCDKVNKADNFFVRLKGLMGKKKLDKGEGLLLEKVSSIHTCFMRIPIDVIYLDKDYVILYKETVRPWRIGKFVKKAVHVLELSEGEGDRFEQYTQIQIIKK